MQRRVDLFEGQSRGRVKLAFPFLETGAHSGDRFLVRAVAFELSVGDAGKVGEGFGEHCSVEARVVFSRDRLEVVPVIAAAGEYCVDVEEVAGCSTVKQGVHFAGDGVIWV